MSWKEQYREKIVSASEAASVINSGDHIICSHAANNPQVIMRELVAQKERLRDVHIFLVLPLGYGEYMQPENAAHFKFMTIFVGAPSRKGIAEGVSDYLPSFFKDLPGMIGKEIPVDVAIINVSPPDKNGFCSLGLSCDCTKAAVEKAGKVIAQVNECMPYVEGEANKVPMSRFDYIVPCADPMPELAPPVISDIEREIGLHCASLVNDGDTLQLGIGAIPDAVLLFLKDKKDLGIHSEMISDGTMELMKSGVINGRRKTLHPGKAVVSFLMGTRSFYDFLGNNPDIEMLPIDYVNDPWIIGQNDNMVSINSCIEVDLFGQVNAESLGLKQFSGTGGQVDFVRGAALSKGGRSIIAMPSTAARGTVSRIVPMLSAGAAVTTSRNDVDYIVTEYGLAKLKGKTLRERAGALIAIAHPDFRKSLTEEFERRFHGVLA
jgi:4-hydroxybutyrate CoA-transferase